VLTIRGGLTASIRIDCRVTMLRSAPGPLEQNDPVDFFCGSTESPAWPTLLNANGIAPGETGWVHLRLKSPVAVAKGDRFIIRRASPSETIGGGVVIDAQPRRHKRFRQDVISTLEVLEIGSPEEVMIEALRNGPVERRQLLTTPPAGLEPAHAEPALASLLTSGEVIALAPTDRVNSPAAYVVASAWWEEMAANLQNRLKQYHQDNPLRRGIQREELRSRLEVPQRQFDAIIGAAAASGLVAGDDAVVRLAGFTIRFDAATRALVNAYLAALRVQPFSPPSPGDFGIDGTVLGVLVDSGQVVKVADGIAYDSGAYIGMVEQVMTYLDEHGSITLASYRDLIGASRKYAQAVLEYFDQQKLTRRVGDERRRYTTTTGR